MTKTLLYISGTKSDDPEPVAFGGVIYEIGKKRVKFAQDAYGLNRLSGLG
jgi:hypothetical protein